MQQGGKMEKKDLALFVEQAKKGNKDSFIKLYESVYKDLYKFAFFTLQNKQDAEDVISETVMDAYVGITNLREASAFRGWIFRICSNKCKRKMKEYIKERELQGIAIDEEEGKEIADGIDVTNQMIQKQDIKQALGSLSAEERMIIIMTAISGYTTKEVAKYLEKKHSTVRAKYRRGLQKLRVLLGGNY